MKKRIAAFLLVMITVLSVAASASAKAFDGGSVFEPGQGSKK
ncbi:MAG: hypothetical protein ACOY94_27350 [Bacillota bacterium]